MVRAPLPIVVVLAALAVAVFALPVMAQPRVIERPVMGGYGDPTMLLRMPQIQEELELADEQKAKLKEIGDEAGKQMREQWSGLRDLSPDERQAKYAELREKMAERSKETRKKVEAILLPHQKKRLQQIGIQLRMRWQGVSGIVDDSEIAKQLGLTAAQKEQLKKIAEETRQKLQNLPREIMEEGRKRAVDVLTAEQKKTLEEAIGAKFELRRSRPGAGAAGGAIRVRKVEKKEAEK